MNEEDIKILEDLLNRLKYNISLGVVNEWNPNETFANAIENLINKNKELEEENKKKSIAIICYQEDLENRIPTSLVKEKIEEYTKLLTSCNRFSDVDRIKALNEKILAYRELLEE